MKAKYEDFDASGLPSPGRKPAAKIQDLRQALKEKYKMPTASKKKQNEPPLTKADLLKKINSSSARLSVPRRKSVPKLPSAQPQTESSPVLEVKPQKPLLYIDIDIGDGNKDRITVYEPDSAKELASNFCQKHEFD